MIVFGTYIVKSVLIYVQKKFLSKKEFIINLIFNAIVIGLTF